MWSAPGVITNIRYSIAPDAITQGDFDALLISGDRAHAVLNRRLKESFPAVSWSELGEQGYFLSIGRQGDKTAIYLGANTEQGRFYGFQSLRQMAEKEPGKLGFPQADIVDRPTLSRRGIAMGQQWMKQRGSAIERLAELKCNFIHNQGSFMGGKFGGHHPGSGAQWRLPLTEGEIAFLTSYLNMARDNFIDISINLSPRLGEPGIRYSSDEDINIIVDKMSVLYDAGFRNVGLNFDDLQNVGMERLTEPVDIQKFENDIGKAHYYFTLEVYNRLRQKHPAISFYFLPLWYGGFVRLAEEKKGYLRTVGKLPRDIIFVSCPSDMANIEEAKRLTGRYHLIWDNYFAGFETGGSPVFVPPIDRSRAVRDTTAFGYVVLPMVPANDDAAGTSWMTGSDYMWSPERYEPDQSFRRAAARAVGGGKAVALLEEYYKHTVSGIRKAELPHGEELQTLELRKPNLPDSTRERRLAVLQDGIHQLNEWKKKLQAAVPEKLFRSIGKEIDDNVRILRRLLAENEEKPVPGKVR